MKQGAATSWASLAIVAIAVGGAFAAPAAARDSEAADLGIELIVPPGEVHTGYLRFEARLLGKPAKVRLVDRVAFEVDGRPALVRDMPPFAIQVDIGHLPRQRVIRAIALGTNGAVLAVDQHTINGGPHRFALRFVEPLPDASSLAAGGVDIGVEPTVPEGRVLARLEIFDGDTVLARFDGPPYRLALPAIEDLPLVLRARGELDDGRSTEDAVVLGGAPAAAEVAVDLVEVYVTVTDGRERPIPDLTVDAFSVAEEGVRVIPRQFERVENLPVHATVLLDTSASMAPRIGPARDAVIRFFAQAVRDEDDAVALIAFNDRAHLIAPYTHDSEQFAAAVDGLRAARSTALYDSLVYALYYQGGIDGHRALLLVSDGADEISRFSLDDALEYAQRARVTIYTVGLDLGGDGSRRTLERMAAETGGRSFFVDAPDELESVYQSVLRELRSRYLLVYQSPADDSSDRRRFRRVDVTVKGRGLRARAMRGYIP